MNEQTKAAIDNAFDAADHAFDKASEAFKAARRDPSIRRTYRVTLDGDDPDETSDSSRFRFKAKTWAERWRNFRRFGGMAIKSLLTGEATLTCRKR